MRALTVTVAACLAALALALYEQAHGLSCASVSTPAQALRLSDAAFEGVVVGGSKPEVGVTPGKPESAYEGSSHRFRVARYLRGRQGQVVVVRILPIGGFPSSRPLPGEAWRVYATRDRSSGRLSFNPCVPFSKRLEGAGASRVRELLASNPGAETRPTSSADDDDGLPLALAIGIGAVVVAAAALLTVRLRRSR